MSDINTKKNYYHGFNEREKEWQVFLWDYDQKRGFVSPTFENSGYTEISGPFVYDKAINLCPPNIKNEMIYWNK
jgi:hypothetical protein